MTTENRKVTPEDVRAFAGDLESAPRLTRPENEAYAKPVQTDDPEGTVYIMMSDTLSRQVIEVMRSLADQLEEANHLKRKTKRLMNAALTVQSLHGLASDKTDPKDCAIRELRSAIQTFPHGMLDA